jgi:hypothetical protein
VTGSALLRPSILAECGHPGPCTIARVKGTCLSMCHNPPWLPRHHLRANIPALIVRGSVQIGVLKQSLGRLWGTSSLENQLQSRVVKQCLRMVPILKLLVPILLVQAVLAVTAQQHQAMKTGSAASAGPQSPCVTAPTAAECSQFTYPQASAAADIGSLCKGMHFMASCSVAKACNASGAGPDGNPRGPGAADVSRNNPDVCDPFQHVTTVCRLDAGMSRMSGTTTALVC